MPDFIEDTAIVWSGGFKAFGVDAELTSCFTLLCSADARDVS